MPNIRLGKLMGIPILVSPSFFIVYGLFTWLLATELYPETLEDRSRAVHFLLAGASAAAFFACVIIHELAHSVVARIYRIPVRSITLFVFGGVAQITRDATRPLGEFLMAIAGPGASLVIAAILLGGWALAGGGDDSTLELTLVWLGSMNLVVGLFNLIPAFPADGGRVFRSAIWGVSGNYNLATNIAGWTGRVIAWGLMGLGTMVILGFDVLIEREPVGGFWLILVGLFLEGAARASLFQNKLVQLLKQYRARDLMTTDIPTVDASVSLGALARGALELNPRLCFMVETDGRLAGILTAHQLRAIPERQWDDTTAGQAMLPSGKLKPTTPERAASDILVDMELDNLSHMPVVEEGRVLGLIGRDRIFQVIRQAGLLPSA